MGPRVGRIGLDAVDQSAAPGRALIDLSFVLTGGVALLPVSDDFLVALGLAGRYVRPFLATVAAAAACRGHH